ncbi:MAG: 6-carboxytetrahydropterin synthase QueD [Desulfobulbaceae bacterium]|uniref:6-carboxy-5,6,7,8-tetrahydropterin synthase n=1 Tax=Candidatus Desulfatifera sulfidica TaxID=2841691 RepID=A0A8J6TD36_9BACT|nr:6-carboxytetrahydropterin synthase QueD [Candidatus Desulfatifera sulfidica]
MYDIFIDTHFAGAHHLRDYPGNCEKPHGHNWKVRVTVRASEIDELGMGIDFKILKKEVNSVVDLLDHQDLNTLAAFQDRNPSSEHIAAFLFNQLSPILNHDRYHIHSVTVHETESSGLTYYGTND